jgi:DNA-binding transcriptional regulator LsrR (DeoR family)
MVRNINQENNRLDEAARAGWLYYIAGNTQDEIARKLGVSRQTAQRLVSLAMSEKLIKVRLDHPIANCLELSERLKQAYEIEFCDVVPSDPEADSLSLGAAHAGAAQLERHLESSHPIIVAMGTGRMLRAMVDQLTPMDCPQHKIVSLVGNMASDGSASLYDVVSRVAEVVKAPHYPMPLPVISTTVQDRALLLSQRPVQNVIELARQADVTFVGIGTVGDDAALLRDGFVKPEEMRALVKAGAVGEIIGWAYDRDGQLIEGHTNDRVASVALQQPAKRKVIGIAIAPRRFHAIRGALRGKLINGLITNENMAGLLLA